MEYLSSTFINSEILTFLAAYPVPGLRENKHWPTCSRIDDAFGDRNLATAAINRS